MLKQQQERFNWSIKSESKKAIVASIRKSWATLSPDD